MPVAAHVRFIELLEDVDLAAGELAFAEGDPPDHFLFLTEGRVALETEGLHSIEFSGFAVVGVVDAILERPRQRACRALEASKALRIRSADWFDMLEDNAEIARSAIKTFATQLHSLWQQLAPRLPGRSEPPSSIVASALETYDKILALRQASFLRRAGMQAIASLAAVAETEVLQAKQSLFEVGNSGEDFFVVSSRPDRAFARLRLPFHARRGRRSRRAGGVLQRLAELRRGGERSVDRAAHSATRVLRSSRGAWTTAPRHARVSGHGAGGAASCEQQLVSRADPRPEPVRGRLPRNSRGDAENSGRRAQGGASPEACPRAAPHTQRSFQPAACAGSTMTCSWSAPGTTAWWPRCARRAPACALLVLERASVIGGATRTEYPFARAPELPHSTGAYLLGLMPPELLRELELEIPLLRRDPHYFLPRQQQGYLLFARTWPNSSGNSCSFFSRADFEAHVRLQAELEALREDIAPTWLRQPYSIEETAERYVRPALRHAFVRLCRGSGRRVPGALRLQERLGEGHVRGHGRLLGAVRRLRYAGHGHEFSDPQHVPPAGQRRHLDDRRRRHGHGSPRLGGRAGPERRQHRGRGVGHVRNRRG